MTTAMPDGGGGILEDSHGEIFEVELTDKVLEKSERGKRIVKCVVPGLLWSMRGEIVQAQSYAKIAE